MIDLLRTSYIVHLPPSTRGRDARQLLGYSEGGELAQVTEPATG
jgi:hypothetical protein